MSIPARDALLKLSSNASSTRDASAPQELTDQKKQELKTDQDLMSMKRECKAFCDSLIAEYHQLHRARGTELYNKFQNIITKYGILEADIYNFDETGFQMGVISTIMVITSSKQQGKAKKKQPSKLST
ncbi:uncharacterized protein EURHEDRAFT_415979 [Aspergillus ruber CBS 135680]|uniref:Uncharacterized protein n=1 Tax=Aspergillus ruber (strain CBS 135680) TaxID=1388766 RepID=A0A017S4V4_ASPRC|nr:uncharacterized protein EURHEDRAFT_415979 [Aspergillus ruber CBS 135680]EYE91977.1 hypothetical protein EURHEDRAFT_415979 [Aspergillus ruber CBS 135680]